MRFSIRDLLWLTVVVALGVGWWIDRSRLAAECERHRPISYSGIRANLISPPAALEAAEIRRRMTE